MIIAGDTPVAITTYTPAITLPGTTISAVTAMAIKVPGMLYLWGAFTMSAAGGGATITIPLPSGFTAAPTGLACGYYGATSTASGNGTYNTLITFATSIQSFSNPSNRNYGFFAYIPTTS